LDEAGKEYYTRAGDFPEEGLGKVTQQKVVKTEEDEQPF
jgi:hypothetical protein